jgi:Fe-S-cluster containining protein
LKKLKKTENKNNDCLASEPVAGGIKQVNSINPEPAAELQSRECWSEAETLRKGKRAVTLKICKQVSQIYDWLNSQIKSLDVDCSACGKCCDFKSFGHKLFVTTPELLYFYKNVKPLRKMTGSSCPCLENGKCTARDFRFSGCRIFFCKADSEKINELSEQTIKKIKTLCDEFDFPYRYVDWATALNNIDFYNSVNPRSVAAESVSEKEPH